MSPLFLLERNRRITAIIAPIDPRIIGDDLAKLNKLELFLEAIKKNAPTTIKNDNTNSKSFRIVFSGSFPLGFCWVTFECAELA